MKIRSLLLGSVAAAGLSTGAYAADLGVLTSLDVCDALGLSGLTISSDTNCLVITGSVSYEFVWGDYEGDTENGLLLQQTSPANDTVTDPGGGYGAFSIATPGQNVDEGTNNDWYSKIEAWIQFAATADSDFGPAKAVIRIRERQYRYTVNEFWGIDGSDTEDPAQLDTYIHGDDTGGAQINEAYVAIGDSTVIMAGRKGSIMNFGDDVPLNFLGLFGSEKVDTGVKWTKDRIPDGGHVIQIVSDLGNGVSVGAALENLGGTGSTTAATPNSNAGTAVGVISYAGDGLAAHLTVAASGILDGTVERWGYHAGVSGAFDPIRFVAAISGDDTGYWHALASAAATFDMFTLAVSGEAKNGGNWGVGGSVSAGVTDGVTINLGGRWYHNQTAGPLSPEDGWQVAAQLVAAVTETITLTGEVGVYGGVQSFDEGPAPTPTGVPHEVYYGAAQVAWAPGGGLTSSLKGEVYSNGAYKATFKAAKTFE